MPADLTEDEKAGQKFIFFFIRLDLKKVSNVIFSNEIFDSSLFDWVDSVTIKSQCRGVASVQNSSW
jgi:hypothetical protein